MGASHGSHHLSKRAKDIGSAGVLIALINVAPLWSSVLFFETTP